ncbi:MAG: sugar transferase, partial [SAR324 cluster bacterium]|nr:sugar transferase [SAR324 cluster bacterium]
MYPRYRSFLLACFDLGLVATVWWTQKLLGHGNWQTSFWPIVIVLSIVLIGFLYALDTYHLGRDRSKAKTLILVMIASGGFHVILPFIFRAFDTNFSLAAVTFSFLINVAYLFFIRTIFSRISSYQSGNLIVIGENEELEWTQKFCDNLPEFELVGFVTMKDSAQTPSPYLGHVDALLDIIEQYQVDTICISCRKPLPENLSKQLLHMKLNGVTIVSFSEFCQTFGGYIPLEYINEQWFLENFGLSHLPFLLHIKRLMDICFGVIGLILLCPATLIVVTMNRFYNPGPLLYSQMRVGLYSKEFRLFKFRSMSVDAEEKNSAQ